MFLKDFNQAPHIGPMVGMERFLRHSVSSSSEDGDSCESELESMFVLAKLSIV